MKLLTKEIEARLRANARLPEREKARLRPALKLFNPCGAATWLITELAEDGDTMFGLCDLGLGHPELGCVSLSEIAGVRTRLGLGVERDLHFRASKTLAEYHDDALAKQRIDA